MYSNYPQLENIVKYVGDAAAASVMVLSIGSLLRWRRLSSRPIWPLIAWPLLAMLACGVLLDLVRWQRSGWTIHFAIHCAAFFGVLVLAMRGRKEGNRRKTSISGTDDGIPE